MSSNSITIEKAKKNSIIKVFNDDIQRYTNVIIPSKVTIGLGGEDFSEGLATHGPIEFKTTSAPSTTSLKLYVVGTSLYFNGSEIGSGGGSGETYDLNATTDGANVDLNLTSTSGTDNSVVQLSAGTNITLTRNSSAEVTITAASTTEGWTDDGAVVRLTTSTDKVGIGTSSPIARLEVGDGYGGSNAIENISITNDSTKDTAIDLIEEHSGISSGFGTANAYGFRLMYDGGDNKLYFKTGAAATVTTVGTWDRSSGILQTKKEYHHHFQGYRGGSAKMYPDWYGSADVTDLNTTGQYSQAMLMAPYNGYFKSAKIRCLNATSGTPGATVIAAHKGGSITNIDPQAVTISALNTEYEVEFSDSATAFTKGELLSLSVNPNSSISYFLIDLTLVYDEQT